MNSLLLACSLYTLAFLPGCVPRPLHGGRALTTGPITQSLSQTENPSAPSSQSQETIRTISYTLPAGSALSSPPSRSTLSRSNTLSSIILSAPMPVTERDESRARTELGPTQKDTTREFAAKLSSLKGIVWVGVGLFIFGIASLVWPPLKAIIASVTTSVAVALGGVALIILPTLIVGNEVLILGAVSLAVGGWFLAHRHGHLRGQLSQQPAPHTHRLTVSRS